jgi:anti-anti-sigma regulatory factor
MVIRIDNVGGSPRVVRVAGSVAGEDVAVLRELVAREGLPDSIDLSDVEFVDAQGAHALRELEAVGAALVGAVPFVALLLRSRPGPSR